MIWTVELRMSDVAGAVSGRLVGPDGTVSGASADSRTIAPGQLFVPVVAERDGHDFVPAALEAGAAGYLTSVGPAGGSAVVVDDTVVALAELGRHARTVLDGHRSPVRVIGVTGSVGKTSVKDLIATVLAANRPTWASERSFNNELGVPLTILNAPAGTQALVVEMGARGEGHIKQLCDVALPNVGVVTRVAAVHTEQFGTLDDVAQAKGELVEALPDHGLAVLNAADARVAGMAGRTSARVVTFGEGGDVRAEGVDLDEDLRASFLLVSPWGSADVRLGTARGLHMVENALAAAAVGLACDVPLEVVAESLGRASLSPWRMELLRSPAGGLILNDAYNANPTSVAAALRSLAALPGRRRVAVLGLMAELGPASDDEHRATGELARSLGIDVVAVDVPAYGGQLVHSLEEAAQAVGDVDQGLAVLVKGSRVAGLERLVSFWVQP